VDAGDNQRAVLIDLSLKVEVRAGIGAVLQAEPDVEIIQIGQGSGGQHRLGRPGADILPGVPAGEVQIG